MGTATAGIAHAAIAAHLMGLPMGYVRSGAKDHGRQNRIEGKLTEGEKVVVIEDLISTGGSLIETVEALREAGADVLGAVSIFTYGMEKGKQRLAEAKVRAVSLTDFDEIVAVAEAEGYIPAHTVPGLMAFRDEPLGRELDGRQKMRHLIDILDLSTEEITGLLDQADEIIAHPEDYRERCKYKKLATLFFEPSTRTRLSFEAAMLRARRQRARLFRGEQLLRREGRERGGHHPRRRLLRRHHRHAPPQGGRAHGRGHALDGAHHKRGRRRPQPPDPDAHRPA